MCSLSLTPCSAFKKSYPLTPTTNFPYARQKCHTATAVAATRRHKQQLEQQRVQTALQRH